MLFIFCMCFLCTHPVIVPVCFLLQCYWCMVFAHCTCCPIKSDIHMPTYICMININIPASDYSTLLTQQLLKWLKALNVLNMRPMERWRSKCQHSFMVQQWIPVSLQLSTRPVETDRSVITCCFVKQQKHSICVKLFFWCVKIKSMTSCKNNLSACDAEVETVPTTKSVPTTKTCCVSEKYSLSFKSSTSTRRLKLVQVEIWI